MLVESFLSEDSPPTVKPKKSGSYDVSIEGTQDAGVGCRVSLKQRQVGDGSRRGGRSAIGRPSSAASVVSCRT